MVATTDLSSPVARNLLEKIQSQQVVVAVIGLGYVGLPLALAFAKKGFSTLAYDIDTSKIDKLAKGESYIKTIPSEPIAETIETGKLIPTATLSDLQKADALSICLPTPLNKHREPDLSYVENTARDLVPHLRKGQIVCLVSTTYPGTTDEIVRTHVEKTGLKLGTEIFQIYSPEREDPGNIDFDTSTTPRVVGGENGDALALGCALFGQIVETIIPVSSLATAEAVKLTENIFRAVNIALVNELKILFERMDIDVWEVINAAKSKPFGYMPFYPGPGLGGHCIPIDPFYLTWKAREFGVSTRFIELAGEVNNAMPEHVVRRLQDGLDEKMQRSIKGSKVLLVGVAYKKNVDDTRESPAFKILELLLDRGARVDYLDPLVPTLPATRKHPDFAGFKSIDPKTLASAKYDAAIICTDHDQIDYNELTEHVGLVIDTRNATKSVSSTRGNIIKA